MLEFAPSSDSSHHTRMPLDFTPYLLSASPPSSSFEFHSCSLASNRYDPHFPPIPHPADNTDPPVDSTLLGTSLNSRRNGQLKSIIIKSDSDGDLSGATSDGESTPTSPCSPGRMRKRVSFADNCGKTLATVRVMSESSDEPPTLRPETMAALSIGAPSNGGDSSPLKLTFSQPASDYLAFRDKIEQNFVCLENVLLKERSVVGTIKVKNVSFQKRVFVRFTCDSWRSFVDVEGKYVPGPGDIPGRPSYYDTFSFEFDIPSSADTTRSIEFAVCFEENGSQKWDSNNGANYVIVWDMPAVDPVNSVLQKNENKNNPFVFGPSSLANYAAWHHTDDTPYY